jgi:hypothetical protein
MNSTTRHLPLGLALCGMLVCACAPAATQAPASVAPSVGGASIVGTWDCLPPGASEPDVIEISAEGTVTVNQGEPTTWSVEGNRGAFHWPEGDHTFTIEADQIVFDDGIVCTRAS